MLISEMYKYGYFEYFMSFTHLKAEVSPFFKRKKLFVGTVPTNKKLSVGTVPTNKKLFVGTVQGRL